MVPFTGSRSPFPMADSYKFGQLKDGKRNFMAQKIFVCQYSTTGHVRHPDISIGSARYPDPCESGIYMSYPRRRRKLDLPHDAGTWECPLPTSLAMHHSYWLTITCTSLVDEKPSSNPVIYPR
jgi:hypothetical protein